MVEKEKGKVRKVILITAAVLFVILSLGLIFGYFYLNSLCSISNKKENVKLAEVNKGGIVNILILGTDAGASNQKRTDTIMILHYNPKNKKATLVSIPRDTLVKINGKNSKINAAYAYGGINMVVDTVQNLMETNINYYVKLDLNGFVKLIDILGGVEMKIEHKMDYDDTAQNLHIHFTKGETVLLNGEKAMEFFRWRENNDGTGLANGDIDRINIQHTFIQKVIQKVKSPAIIPKIPVILSAVSQNVDTNMTGMEILKYAYIFSEIKSSNMNITTLKGTGQYRGNVSYFIWNKNEDSDLLSTLKESGESVNSASVDKSGLKVKVLNGTGRMGLAANYADKLKQKGYTDVTTGNTNKTSRSKVTVYGLSENDIAGIKSDFGIDNVQYAEEKGNYDIVFVLGDDYK